MSEFAKPDRPRGTCQVCGRRIALNQNGTVRYHGALIAGFGRRSDPCQGTGYSPKETADWWGKP